MAGIIQPIMRVLSIATGIYMLLIFIRIILGWFSGLSFGGFYSFLQAICDPYLNWFRRFRIFKNSPLDFTPLIAIVVLSLINNIFMVWANMGSISIAAVLAMIAQGLWSVISWILGFFIVILILRLIAFVCSLNVYTPFWRFVDYIAQPIMYRISRIFFPRRITGYIFRIVFSIIILLLLGAAIRYAIIFITALLLRLPF